MATVLGWHSCRSAVETMCSAANSIPSFVSCQQLWTSSSLSIMWLKKVLFVSKGNTPLPKCGLSDGEKQTGQRECVSRSI
eukprot:264945-Chlamydomonas_euryale.AAC.3